MPSACERRAGVVGVGLSAGVEHWQRVGSR
jgi:hypothetical protein